MEQVVQASPGLHRLHWLSFLIPFALAVGNFSAPLMMSFPLDFERAAEEKFGPMKKFSTVVMSEVAEVQVQPAAPKDPKYLLVNTRNLFWPPVSSQPVPEGETLIHSPHPLQFEPYLYEGFKPHERRILRTTDISMRVLDTSTAQPKLRRENENAGG